MACDNCYDTKHYKCHDNCGCDFCYGAAAAKRLAAPTPKRKTPKPSGVKRTRIGGQNLPKLHARLIEIMTENGATQREISHCLGVSKGVVQEAQSYNKDKQPIQPVWRGDARPS